MECEADGCAGLRCGDAVAMTMRERRVRTRERTLEVGETERRLPPDKRGIPEAVSDHATKIHPPDGPPPVRRVILTWFLRGFAVVSVHSDELLTS